MAYQWVPTDPAAADTVPDAHDPSKRHAPTMLTSDLALRMDPAYEAISRRFHRDPQAFADAFAKAWYKLTHRDMGPRPRYLGKLVPAEQLLWQDPIPELDHELAGPEDIADLKAKILGSGANHRPTRIDGLGVGLDFSRFGQTRRCERRAHPPGTAEGLGSQSAGTASRGSPDVWRVSRPAFNAAQGGGKKVSLADLIVLGGGAAVEAAAKNAGQDVTVPFTPGRMDATAEQTDVEAFAVLEPKADGFRNYLQSGQSRPAEALLIDRAQLMTLTAAGDGRFSSVACGFWAPDSPNMGCSPSSRGR